MEAIRQIAFYGSAYDCALFQEGLNSHAVQLERVLHDPLEARTRLLILGHHLPGFDANQILEGSPHHAEAVAVISHGPFPLNGTPAPTELGSMAYHFRWHSEPALAGAIVDLVSDQLNAEELYRVQHRRFLLLVEDEINFASYFIPLILRELTQRTLSLMPSSVSPERMLEKAQNERPVLLLASSYEQASDYMERFGDRMVGVISALGFPKDGKNDSDAGIRLLEKRNELKGEFPVVIQSAREHREKEILELGASFMSKASPHLLSKLQQHLLDHFGFGDFIFRLPGQNQKEVARARSLEDLLQCLEWVPMESFMYHAGRRHFSNWLGVHGYLQLAEVIREIPAEDGELARRKLLELLQKV